MPWWQRLFRLAGVRFAAHIARPGDVPVKEDTVTKASVASILAGAEGGAEAMLDCGIDIDDTELVANFVNAMADVRTEFETTMRPTWEQCRTNHGEDAVHDFPTAVANMMQASPAFTSPWFLWRLSKAVAAMVSPDVLEAAREVVGSYQGHGVPGCARRLDNAVAKLAAVLPKEAE